MWSVKRLPQLCLGMREWCMLDLPRLETRCHSTVASVYTALPLWGSHKYPELLWITPWVLWSVTGRNKMPPAMGMGLSAKSYALGQTCFAGRHPKLPAGQFFLLKPAVDSSRGQAVYGMEFSNKCVHGHTPYHAMDSREHGPRPSGHQSRISMHDGPKAKCATWISNEMQAQNTSKGPNPYHDWSRGKGCMLNEMQPRHGG